MGDERERIRQIQIVTTKLPPTPPKTHQDAVNDDLRRIQHDGGAIVSTTHWEAHFCDGMVIVTVIDYEIAA